MEIVDSNYKKKEEIADKFMHFFLRHGMVKTIVSDVAKELHMSKKTIYKYFKGGKQECLYFIFSKIANQARENVYEDLRKLSTSLQKIEHMIRQIFKISVPYVLGNVADTEKDYLIENQIVGNAFKDTFQDIFIDILQEGINRNEFSIINVNQTFNFIYGIILESMISIHDDINVEIVDQVILTVRKILTK